MLKDLILALALSLTLTLGLGYMSMSLAEEGPVDPPVTDRPNSGGGGGTW